MMRNKIWMACLLLGSVLTVRAQGAREALLFGQNNYVGTARSVAMGNAFTALGGDIGSIGINPAGAAVNSWSQMTITPSLSIYGGSTSYDGDPRYSKNRTRMYLPNVGAILNFKTYRTSGLKNISFGFVMNSTGLYNTDFAASGRTNRSSFTGYLADAATRKNLSPSQLEGYSDLWPASAAYCAGLIYPATTVAGAPYISPVQSKDPSGVYPMRGAIDQQYGLARSGSKHDMVFNLGFNISNRVFFGANLGLVSLEMREDEYMRETAVNTADFPVSLEDDGKTIDGEYAGMKISSTYKAEGSGVYGKFGLIVVPVDGLRVGAAVQTPTASRISELRYYDATARYKGASEDWDAASPDYTYDYALSMPWRYNFGLALTLGDRGLVSADYELTDFSNMRYSERHSNDEGTFQESNDEIQESLGMTHYLRLGAEYKPLSTVALRAGYNLSTNPAFKADGAQAYWHAASLGLGYSSSGSFFCDFALRCKINPTEWHYPYPTYISGQDSPEISLRSRLWDAVLTLGFRF